MFHRCCALLLVTGALSARAQTSEVLITGASVIDVRSGVTRSGLTLRVAGGVIASVGPDRGVSPALGARVIDARGKFVIPGLWDMHMHFGGGDSLIAENRNLLGLYLANGITTIRDAAGDLATTVVAWRDSIASGAMDGPTIFTSGPKLEGIQSIWPGDLEVGTRAEVDAALDRIVALRADFVKITDNTLDPELFLYALGAVRRRGLRSSAHIPQPIAVRDAVEAGLGSIEHLSYAIKAGSPREAELARQRAEGRIPRRVPPENAAQVFDEDIAMSTYRLMAERGVAITPTLSISRTLAYLDSDDHTRDPELAFIGPGLRATYRGRVEAAARADAAGIERRHRSYEFAKARIPLLQRAGVTIFAGTDAGFLNSFVYPGFALHQEMALLQEAGLTPLETLQAATINGARWLGQDRRSAGLEPGMVADLVVLDANPLIDVRATRSIRGVMVRGRYFDRAALDAMLDEVRRRASAPSGARPD